VRWVGVTEGHAARLRRLPDDVRDRVVERAAIVAESTGCGWEEADAEALVLEGVDKQRSLFGGAT